MSYSISSRSASTHSNNSPSDVDPSIDTAHGIPNTQATTGSSSFGSIEGQSHVTGVGNHRYNPELPEMKVLTTKSTLVQIIDYMESVVEIGNKDFRKTWKTEHHDPLVSAIEKFETTLSELAQGCNWMYRLHNNFSIVATRLQEENCMLFPGPAKLHPSSGMLGTHTLNLLFLHKGTVPIKR